MPEEISNDGRLVDLGERRVLRFVRRYPVAPAELWAAITEPDRMGRWAFRGELEPRSGGSVRFDLGEAGISEGTVLEWNEPSVLEYEWASGSEMPWRVRFELTADGEDATLLTFDHVLPDPADPSFAAGWHWHLDRLATHLSGDEPADVASDEHFEELLEAYRTAFRA